MKYIEELRKTHHPEDGEFPEWIRTVDRREVEYLPEPEEVPETEREEKLAEWISEVTDDLPCFDEDETPEPGEECWSHSYELVWRVEGATGGCRACAAGHTAAYMSEEDVARVTEELAIKRLI